MDPWKEFLKLFEVRPEEAGLAVLEIFGGSASTSTLDGILEGIFRSNPEFWAGKFPFVGMPVFPERLPPADDLIVALIGPIVSGLGALTKNKDLFRVGVGQSLYGVPMWFKELVARNVQAATGGSSPPTSQGGARSVRTKGRYRVTS